MFLVKLINLMRGYVVIIIEGIFPERFLNICARRGIYLWNVKRIDKLNMRANVSVRGFKLLRPIAKKSRCKIKLKTRRGVPFFVYKHRNRKSFVIGALLFGAVLLIITRFIWVIEITGNETVPSQQIITSLEEAGLKIGIQSSKINTSDIQSSIMIKNEKISWIGIHIKGTTAHIEIKERMLKPEPFPKNEPCNITAACDGVIESIDALNGQRLVSVGDVVRQGQLLISGALDSKMGEGVRYLHADGEIIARTWHEFSVEIPKNEEVKTRTKNSKSKHMIKIFNFCIKLFIKDGISYANYDRISYVKNLSFGNDIVLPISFHYDNYYEVEITQRELQREEAIEISATSSYEQMKGSQIIDLQNEITENNLKLTYECLESIVLKQAILREETKDNGENSGG